MLNTINVFEKYSPKFIKEETPLYDELGEPAAFKCSLDDVLAFVESDYPLFDSTVHYEDYDDYGVDYYVKLVHEKLTIKIEKDFGGMFCPTDCLKVVMSANSGFEMKFPIADFWIGKHYESIMKQYMDLVIELLDLGLLVQDARPFEPSNLPVNPDEFDCFADSVAESPTPHFELFQTKEMWTYEELNALCLQDPELSSKGVCLKGVYDNSGSCLVVFSGYVGGYVAMIKYMLSGIKQREDEIWYQTEIRVDARVEHHPGALAQLCMPLLEEKENI
jgi:hypothetical protein